MLFCANCGDNLEGHQKVFFRRKPSTLFLKEPFCWSCEALKAQREAEKIARIYAKVERMEQARIVKQAEKRRAKTTCGFGAAEWVFLVLFTLIVLGGAVVSK